MKYILYIIYIYGYTLMQTHKKHICIFAHMCMFLHRREADWQRYEAWLVQRWTRAGRRMKKRNGRTRTVCMSVWIMHTKIHAWAKHLHEGSFRANPLQCSTDEQPLARFNDQHLRARTHVCLEPIVLACMLVLVLLIGFAAEISSTGTAAAAGGGLNCCWCVYQLWFV
jgi:hypothetical protein